MNFVLSTKQMYVQSPAIEFNSAQAMPTTVASLS